MVLPHHRHLFIPAHWPRVYDVLLITWQHESDLSLRLHKLFSFMIPGWEKMQGIIFQQIQRLILIQIIQTPLMPYPLATAQIPHQPPWQLYPPFLPLSYPTAAWYIRFLYLMIPPLVVVIIMIIFNIIVILPPFLSQMTAANVTVLYRLLSFIMIREPSAPAWGSVTYLMPPSPPQ